MMTGLEHWLAVNFLALVHLTRDDGPRLHVGDDGAGAGHLVTVSMGVGSTRRVE